VLIGYMNGIALLMIVRQLGNLTGGPVEGGSVTHQLPSVVTHLHLAHPPTLAVGSAILAMLFVIAWRFSALSGSVDRDDPGCGCVAFVRSGKQRDQTVWDALFGCVRAARVQAETAHRRPFTRERMTVLCRESND
jgi:hypothetical protein